MVRTTVSNPQLAGTPLDELKQFLSITVTRDDAVLESLLQAAHSLCETFTGLTLLETTFDETICASGQWQTLATRPVRNVLEARLLGSDGTSEALGSSDFEFDIHADGGAIFRLKRTSAASRVAVRITAQIADEWNLIPADLRHGLIRLAAHSYRERDNGPLAQPPASVAALWRPHRRLKL